MPQQQGRILHVDFTDAPPAQGGSFDRIPQGKYMCKLVKIDTVTTTSGSVPGATQVKAQIEVVEGESVGKRLGDSFVLPRPNSNDKKFGLQRFHAFVVAYGGKPQRGTADIPLDRFVGRVASVEVRDKVMEARDQYAERTISQPIAYYRPGQEGKTPTLDDAPPSTNGAQPAAVQAPAAEQAPEQNTLNEAMASADLDAIAEQDDLFDE